MTRCYFDAIDGGRRQIHAVIPLTEMIDVFRELFRRPDRDETIRAATKPFSAPRASREKPPVGIRVTKDDGVPPPPGPGDRSMRALSLILAFGFVLAGSTLAGVPDGNLPGVGTFRYSGPPVTIASPQPVVLAGRL
jgi:hypothetical protein